MNSIGVLDQGGNCDREIVGFWVVLKVEPTVYYMKRLKNKWNQGIQNSILSRRTTEVTSTEIKIVMEEEKLYMLSL